MNKRILLVLIGFLISMILGACRPSQAELDAQATQLAANLAATQTATVPTSTSMLTNTPTFAPTSTATATSTNFPTGTPTNIPTGTPTNTPTSTSTHTPTATFSPTPTVPPTFTPTPTALPPTLFDGTYQGTTSQGKELVLVVEGNGIRSVLIDFDLPGCELFTPFSTYYGQPEDFINENSFSLMGDALTITGSFSSRTSISGMLQLKVAPCGGELKATWKADFIPAPSSSATPIVERVTLPTGEELSLKRISLDSFMADSINSKFPFEVEIPENYVLLRKLVRTGHIYWLPPEYFETAEITEELPDQADYFYGIISLAVTYDATIDSFMCLNHVPCNDASSMDDYESQGIKVNNIERLEVDGFPMLFVDITFPQEFRLGDNKLYQVYIGGLIGPDVLYIAYVPSHDREAEGEIIWKRFKAALLQSK